jgi:uncharacterized membrane protein YfcA
MSTSRIIWYSVVPVPLVVAMIAGLVPVSAATLLIIPLCAVLELVDSSLGMGYGTSLTPILLMLGYDPLQLVPTILISEFLSGFAAAFFHHEAGNVRFVRGSNHPRAAVLLSAFSLIGVFLGVHTALRVSALVLTRLIGVVIVGAGVYILVMIRRTFYFSIPRIVALAVIASFNKALSGGGYGPLMTSGQIMSGIRGRAAVAITSLAEGFTCLAGSVLFLTLGKRLDPALLLPVVTGALLSVPVSAHLVRRFSEHGMKVTVAVMTIVLGVLTLARTL